jgi:hypothetical protein
MSTPEAGSRSSFRFSASGQHHLARRRRVEKPVGDHQQQQGQEDERAGGGQQVAERQQRVAEDFGHDALGQANGFHEQPEQ